MLLHRFSGLFSGRPKAPPTPRPPRVRSFWLGDSAKNVRLMDLDRQAARQFGKTFLLAGQSSFIDPTPFPDEDVPDECAYFLPIRFIQPFAEMPLITCFLTPRPDRQPPLNVTLETQGITERGFVLVLRGPADLGRTRQAFGWFATDTLEQPMPPSVDFRADLRSPDLRRKASAAL